MGNRNLKNHDDGRHMNDSAYERERSQREADWSPAARSQNRAREMYQDVHESRGFYEQPRDQRLSGGTRSEGEFYGGRSETGERSGSAQRSRQGVPGVDNYSLGHKGKGPKNYTRSDERIREDVCDRLYDDDRLDASDIDVNVDRGEVTLTGEVADRGSKRRAEDLAELCSGVVDVHNRLRVQSGNPAGHKSSSAPLPDSKVEPPDPPS